MFNGVKSFTTKVKIIFDHAIRAAVKNAKYNLIVTSSSM